jgi:serine/threonine protein kinase
MLAAGRGLVAAHAAGLDIRDRKPDKIMIDREGRVRVMDFGLVRAAGHAPPQAAPVAIDALLLHVSVTQVGSLMGTPAYMAPEQWHGREADARRRLILDRALMGGSSSAVVGRTGLSSPALTSR